jgi:DNA-binding XRE family transcriptional regulator
MSNKNKHTGSTWEETKAEMVAKGYVTDEELRESDMRAALMGEIVKARRERNITQRDLERLSGVRQPVIARIENGTNTPKVDTVMKILAPLGMTLAVVPLEQGK